MEFKIDSRTRLQWGGLVGWWRVAVITNQSWLNSQFLPTNFPSATENYFLLFSISILISFQSASSSKFSNKGQGWVSACLRLRINEWKFIDLFFLEMVFLFFFFPLPFASPNRRCRGKLHKSIMKNCFSTDVAVCLRRDNQQQAKDVEAFFRFAWQSRHFVAAQLLREITLWRSHSRKFNAKNNSRLSSLRPTRKKKSKSL